MRYLTFLTFFIIFSLILTSSVYALTIEDLIKNFLSTITGRATETTAETTTSAQPTITESTESTTTTPTETTTQPPTTPVIEQPICPASPPQTTCPENQGLTTKSDDKGCVVSYECIPVSSHEVGISECPPVPPSTIACPPDQQLSKMTDDKGCITGYNCILVAVEKSGAPSEVICPAVVPEKPDCPNGNMVPVFNHGCLVAHSCIPSGCRQETDSSGFARTICEAERVCPAEQQQAELKSECYEQGGNPTPFQDQSGCTFYDCRFDKREIKPNPIGGHQSCPIESEMDSIIRQCENSGSRPSITFEGGCKMVKCVRQEEQRCRSLPESEKIRIDNECSSKGLPIVRELDKEGCAFYRCGETTQDCSRDVPPEAYKKCNSIGGEMIVKNDRVGCIVFSQCVSPGDDRNAYVEPIEEVPDTTVLLSLALKLEQLKVELKKLATESDEIGKYYASVGSLDEERFNRISVMFTAAADKIDEIKIKIRDKVDTLTTDDLVEIKHNIKYLKEVTLKDILYLMLSNSDDVKETLENSREISTKSKLEDIEKNTKDCGTDGFCFDRAIRTCKPVTFKPEGRNGPTVSITGLKDEKCVLHIVMPEGQIPPGYTQDTFYMDCPISDYSLGVRGPEDIIPNCEGPMAKFAKQFGGAASVSGEQFPPPEGGPGGCKTERECAQYCLNNYEECREWTKQHPAYGPMPSREELKQYASGSPPERLGEGPREGGFGGPGGCRSDRECSDFCNRNPKECLVWCEENPGMCPSKAETQLGRAAEGRGFVMCKPEDDREWVECERRGGRPQSDPSPDRRCEIYAGCIEAGGDRCDCTWAAGTPEHPRGCPVLCSDYSYDRAACDAQARNGCKWLVGEVAGVEERPVAQPQPIQACVGCLNNGMCDIGECSECKDCLRTGTGFVEPSSTGVQPVTQVPMR